MAIYYSLLILIAFLGICLCDLHVIRYGRALFSLFSLLGFTFLAGLRYMTGHDYSAYFLVHVQYSFLDWPSLFGQRMEKGYLMVGRLLADVSLEPYVLFLFWGFIFSLMVIIFCHRFSNHLWLSLFSFVSFGFFYNSINFMRQFAAMCILMWALIDIQEKRPFRFLIIVLFASCFHLSALILIPFYLILQIPLNRFVLPVYLCGSLFCFLMSETIMRIVTHFFYKSYRWKKGSELLIGANPGPFIGFFMLLILCLLFRTLLIKRHAFNSILINCLYFGTFFEFLGIKHAIVSRVSILFMTPAVIILVPELAAVIEDLLKERKKNVLPKRLAYTLSCMVLIIPMFLFHAYLLTINYNSVVPYQTLSQYYWGGIS